MYNLLGYFPAPFVYGLVYEYNGGGDSRWGFIALQISGLMTAGMLILTYFIRQAVYLRETAQIEKRKREHMENDQKGPLLQSDSEDDEPIRKRKNVDLSYLSDRDQEDDSDDVDRASSRTPLSERLRLESISVFYSKSLYPTSLGLY